MSEETRPLSKAQKAHLNWLNREMQTAQAELQAFVNYLFDEHEMDPEQWRIDPQRGFIPTNGVDAPDTS